jgi:hypothetical protein
MARSSRPVPPPPGALLLTPGAGADRTHHTLVAVEKAVKAATKARTGSAVPASRLDFPYRRAGRVAPDKAPVAVAHLRAAAGRLVRRAGCEPGQLVLGGRSYGGRMCSLAVAEGLPAAGLVLLSYPLHPPGKPDRLRVEHFPALDLPVLVVSGTPAAGRVRRAPGRHPGPAGSWAARPAARTTPSAVVADWVTSW